MTNDDFQVIEAALEASIFEASDFGGLETLEVSVNGQPKLWQFKRRKFVAAREKFFSRKKNRKVMFSGKA